MTCKRIAPAKWPGNAATTPSDLQGLFLVMAMTRCLDRMDEGGDARPAQSGHGVRLLDQASSTVSQAASQAG